MAHTLSLSPSFPLCILLHFILFFPTRFRVSCKGSAIEMRGGGGMKGERGSTKMYLTTTAWTTIVKYKFINTYIIKIDVLT